MLEHIIQAYKQKDHHDQYQGCEFDPASYSFGIVAIDPIKSPVKKSEEFFQYILLLIFTFGWSQHRRA